MTFIKLHKIYKDKTDIEKGRENILTTVAVCLH